MTLFRPFGIIMQQKLRRSKNAAAGFKKRQTGGDPAARRRLFGRVDMNGLNQATAQRVTHRIHSRLFRVLGPVFFTLCLCLLFGCAGTTAESAFSSIEISSQFLQQTVQLPVLMYHHLIPEDSSESETPVSCFRDQMRALSEAGYHPVSFDEILRWVEDGGILPSKPIAITFDDGYASNYELAYPVPRGFAAPVAAGPFQLLRQHDRGGAAENACKQ